MRNVICWEVRKGDMVETEMPMQIGEFVKLRSEKSLGIAKSKGMALAHRFYWEMVMERLVLYRRRSECKHGLLLAEKQAPIAYLYNILNEKVFYFGNTYDRPSLTHEAEYRPKSNETPL